MLSLTTKLGRRAVRRLREEKVVWLTTVDARNRPQPRPVWFHWDGRTLLVFSQPSAAKLRHVKRNPSVAVNFNTDEDGDDVVVIIGSARILKTRLPKRRIAAYLRKYRRGIADIGMTAQTFELEYSVAVIVTPKKLRGF